MLLYNIISLGYIYLARGCPELDASSYARIDVQLLCNIAAMGRGEHTNYYPQKTTII